MFLRNQNTIDGFAARFSELPNGDLLFAPDGPETGLPVTSEEYEAVLAAYERTHMRGMMMHWGLLLGAGGYGLHQVIVHDTFRPFFIAVGVAFVLSFVFMARDAMRHLQPLEERRQAMLRQASAGATTASAD